jgi:hypothetical protein
LLLSIAALSVLAGYILQGSNRRSAKALYLAAGALVVTAAAIWAVAL